MRIIAKSTLREYWDKKPITRQPLQAWYHFVKKADWSKPEDVIADFGPDAVLPDSRAVFKIRGNDFRLVVRINYQARTVFKRFIGTHQEYDRIDATRI